MREELKRIWKAVQSGAPATLEFEAEGTRYFRNFRPQERLILLGCGHVSQAVCGYAAGLGFAVTAVDDRPSFANRTLFPEAAEVLCGDFQTSIAQLKLTENDYVAVVTRGHRWDADCLRAILPGPFPRYLGMIGSKRRVAALFQMLEDEGFPRETLDRIHSPIGLSIGALTVPEIAVSIAAELIQVRRQGTDRRSKQAILTQEDMERKLLEFLACDETPKTLMVVFETRGSTPVKSGAMMAVDRNYRAVGTIGGGCGESAVLLEAYKLIGTGRTRCVTVNMSNDVAEEEGMVCGGQMKVFLADVESMDNEDVSSPL